MLMVQPKNYDYYSSIEITITTFCYLQSTNLTELLPLSLSLITQQQSNNNQTNGGGGRINLNKFSVRISTNFKNQKMDGGEVCKTGEQIYCRD